MIPAEHTQSRAQPVAAHTLEQVRLTLRDFEARGYSRDEVRSVTHSLADSVWRAEQERAALVAALDETVRQIEVVRLSGYIDECEALDGSLHHTVNAARAALVQAKGESSK